MFKALVVGLFFALWGWARWSRRKAADENQRLRGLLSDVQRQLETTEFRNQRLIMLLTELHRHKTAPTGRVSWKELAEFTVQTAGRLIGMETVVLLRWDGRFGEFRGIATAGLPPQQAVALKIRPGEGILGKAAQSGQVMTVLEPAAPASEPLPQESFLTPPYLIFPLRVRSEIGGLLVFSRPKAGPLGSETLRLAKLVAHYLQVLMENLSLQENRDRMLQTLAETLALALSLKDSDGQMHADQCRSWVRAMAQSMRLPELLTRQIEYGALLHDLGKLGIDQGLLTKSGPLTEAEYAAVKKHPVLGHQMLQDIELFEGIAPIVLYHHEWVNGQGYPEGLAGEEIPLGARMVSIVDAWHTMLTDQPYRKALPRTSAIAELRQQAGTQFDPKLVDVFLHVIEEKPTGAKPAVSQPNA